ncbi:MAG: hypothetical protein ACYS6K_05825, partial [Planctomycetota bacterium]
TCLFLQVRVRLVINYPYDFQIIFRSLYADILSLYGYFYKEFILRSQRCLPGKTKRPGPQTKLKYIITLTVEIWK